MAERLEVIRARPELILDWWGGIGGGAEALAAAYPKARRVVVAPVNARPRGNPNAAVRPWWSPARWTSRGALDAVDENGPIPAPAQLVWANLVLHAAVDPPALMARWNTLLEVDGFAMFSCLGPATLLELRALYRRLDWPAPTPGFIDMHDLGDMLIGAGFADPVMDQETLTIRWQSAEALLADLRALGGNTASDRFPGLRTQRWRRRLLSEIEELRGEGGSIALSFEVAYGHGFKATPRRARGQATTVSLDDMRALVRADRAPR